MSRATLTDDEARALGERWLAAGGGWRAGMVTCDGWRACHDEDGHMVCDSPDIEWCAGEAFPKLNRLPKRDSDSGLPSVPDLRDPATRGACLEVVRERRRDPATHIRPPVNGSGWRAFDGTCAPVRNAQGAPVEADGEAACLVAALEAAPR